MGTVVMARVEVDLEVVIGMDRVWMLSKYME